jgi:hypothetical protein
LDAKNALGTGPLCLSYGGIAGEVVALWQNQSIEQNIGNRSWRSTEVFYFNFEPEQARVGSFWPDARRGMGHFYKSALAPNVGTDRAPQLKPLLSCFLTLVAASDSICGADKIVTMKGRLFDAALVGSGCLLGLYYLV